MSHLILKLIKFFGFFEISSQSPNSIPRTGRPASASVPCKGLIFFPTGWKCQPEGEDIGSGCCGGGVIQLRLRERALLRQGQLFEPTASSGPAAMLLAISRNLSCIPRRSPCPGRYPLPLASGFLSTSQPKKNATHQAASSQISKYYLQIPRRFRIV